MFNDPARSVPNFKSDTHHKIQPKVNLRRRHCRHQKGAIRVSQQECRNRNRSVVQEKYLITGVSYNRRIAVTMTVHATRGRKYVYTQQSQEGRRFESPEDPLLGNVGGAEISFGNESGNNANDDFFAFDLPPYAHGDVDLEENKENNSEFSDPDTYLQAYLEEDARNNQHPVLTQRTADGANALLSLFNANDQPQQQPNQDFQQPLLPQPQPLQESSSNNSNSSNGNASNGSLNSNLVASIAATLKNDGLDCLEPEEKNLVNNCQRGKNDKTYNNKQKALEEKFFSTLKLYGGKTFEPLLELVPADYSHGQEMDYAFYNQLGGEKNYDSKVIMNSALILMVVKWKKESGKKEEIGKPLQPNTFNQYMKLLFYLFKAKGIQFEYDKDFNRPGEFHGVLIDQWNAIRAKDPTFGTCKNRARVDPDFVRIFIKAIEDGTLKPYEDAVDLLRCVIFINGYYLGLRGRTEQADLLMANVFVGRYTISDGEELAGMNWAGVKVPFSKTQQLKLSNCTLTRDRDVILSFVEDPSHAVWDPYAVYLFYLNKCHPKAVRFLCRPCNVSSKGGMDERSRYSLECGKEIWFCPSGTSHGTAVGHNKVGDHCKTLAKVCGIDKWEKMTGHALRALQITNGISKGLSACEVAFKARQKSLNAQLSYEQETKARKINRLASNNPNGKINKKPAFASMPGSVNVQGNPDVIASPPSKKFKPMKNPYVNKHKSQEEQNVSTDVITPSERQELEHYRRMHRANSFPPSNNQSTHHGWLNNPPAIAAIPPPPPPPPIHPMPNNGWQMTMGPNGPTWYWSGSWNGGNNTAFNNYYGPSYGPFGGN